MNPFAFGPGALVEALLSLPLFSLVIAAIIAGVIVLRRGRPVLAVGADRYATELRLIGAVAIAVIVVFAAENIIRGYLLRLVDVVDWWRYPTPLLTATVGLGLVLALVATRGSAPAVARVALPARRTWTTFGPRVGLAVAALVLAALLGTSLAAGLASSSDSEGRFIYLELVAPNTGLDPLRPWFFGWSYGVPVILSALALGVVLVALLQRNAVRPFREPDTVGAESAARASLAASGTSVAVAAGLLALAGAFRFIGRTGTISGVSVGDGPQYDIVWRYAALAEVLGWVAPILEVVAFGMLLLAARFVLVRRPAPAAVGAAR